MESFDWESILAECITFAQRLIRTPSMPGQEAAISRFLADEMRQLRFDDVWRDDVGNVCGRIHGQDRTLGAMVLNSHLDHVDPGEPSLWPSDPYGAEIQDGRIHGRGACDIKGPLAVQVYSMVALKRAGLRPLRDVVFCSVVEEEVGGAGAIHWAKNVNYDVDLIVLGEPSSNHLSLGHRGLAQAWMKFPGRSVHASVPDQGINPNVSLAHFLVSLEQAKDALPGHPLLGKTTLTPTIIEVDTKSMNVTPAWSRVALDFRTAAMSINDLQEFIEQVAGDLSYELSDAWSPVPDVPLPGSDETIYGFYTSPDGLEVSRVRDALEEGMGWRPELRSYQFATDGRHFGSIGATIVGYSPGEEHLAHTVDESISLDMMADSLRGHVNLLRTY